MRLNSIWRLTRPGLNSMLIVGVMAAHTTMQSAAQNGLSTQPSVPAQPTPTGRVANIPHGHPADTNPGRSPHESSHGAEIGGILGGIGLGVGIAEILAHHKANAAKLAKDGPQVPDRFQMNAFEIHGLAAPAWPIVLDFALDAPGLVQVDIIGEDRSHSRFLLSGNANQRAYSIFRLPANFGTKLQTAIYQVRALPPANTNAPAPLLRTYGIGAGEKAVGSVAIDQLTFQPAVIHPRIKEVAVYGFHAHSAFDLVNAEFIFTAVHNGRLVVEKDKEAKLTPVAENTRLNGLTWAGGGRQGEHMLEIRAWRGLATGGDWVVAWSPDIVDVQD